MTCGIYKLWLQDPNKVYVGKSQNIELRVKTHHTALNANKHPSKGLQSEYDGLLNAIVLEELRVFDKEVLSIKEQSYIDKFDSIKNGYNTNRATKGYAKVYTLEQQKILEAFQLVLLKVPVIDIALAMGMTENMVMNIKRNHPWLQLEYPSYFTKNEKQYMKGTSNWAYNPEYMWPTKAQMLKELNFSY